MTRAHKQRVEARRRGCHRHPWEDDFRISQCSYACRRHVRCLLVLRSSACPRGNCA